MDPNYVQFLNYLESVAFNTRNLTIAERGRILATALAEAAPALERSGAQSVLKLIRATATQTQGPLAETAKRLLANVPYQAIASGIEANAAAGAAAAGGAAAGTSLLLIFGAIVVVLGASGISAYMLMQASEDMEYVQGPEIQGGLGTPSGAAADYGFSSGPLQGDVDMLAEPQRMVTYKLIKTKVVKQIPGEATQEFEVSGAQTSLDLATTQPGFTSTGTLFVQVPRTIAGDQEPFTVSAQVDASWDLKATVYNLSVGLNVVGMGKHVGLGDPDPWPQPGSYSLSARQSNELSLATSGLVSKWTENGKNYRSFKVGGHTGVIQTLSGGELTFIYEEEQQTSQATASKQ
jgi:hypothetical protein